MKIIAVIVAALALAACENWSWERARESMLYAPPQMWNWGGQSSYRQPTLCTWNGMSLYCN